MPRLRASVALGLAADEPDGCLFLAVRSEAEPPRGQLERMKTATLEYWHRVFDYVLAHTGDYSRAARVADRRVYGIR